MKTSHVFSCSHWDKHANEVAEHRTQVRRLVAPSGPAHPGGISRSRASGRVHARQARRLQALLYALEGALRDCHWQEVPGERRVELVEAAEAAIAQLPPPRGRPAAGPVTTTIMQEDGEPSPGFGDEPDNA